MLSLLLECDTNATVSLEVFEDVGVQEGDGTLASQTKSSLTSNPVANRADPFWKTLSNWLDAIEAGQLSLKGTVFELYVFGDFEGEVCSLFSNAKSEAEAESALSKVQSLLSGESGKLPGRIRTVLDTDKNRLIPLIVRFRYRHGSGASVEDLKKQLEKTLIPAEFVESGQPAAIRVAEFRNELGAYTRALVFSACLTDMAGPAVPEDIEQSRSRVYVRQLELIAVSDERKLRAISAYLRSSVNRTEWARLGSVHGGSLDDFENRLIDYWQNSRTQCEISLAARPVVERGQYVLAECMKCSTPLQGRIVPHDFVEGCFHALADGLVVGWHPEFETLTADWK
jgi:hypothetical protein